MYLVALTRWNDALTLDHELTALARALALAPYDARLKLVAPTPSIVRTNIAPEAAHALVAALRQRGHGAVTCDANSVPSPRRAITARAFEFETDHFSVIYELQRRVRIGYGSILGVLRAAESSSESQRLETVEKKLDMTSAVLTGGLKLSKTVTKVEKNATSERQPVAYVFHDAEAEPLLLKENALNYESLGAERGRTAHQNFELLVARLRHGAPNALHDDRLLTHKRRSDAMVVRGAVNDRSVSTSNASANDLGAYLLMLAHIEQQL
jgi:hypothetical protein